jgi:hypothetical protein
VRIHDQHRSGSDEGSEEITDRDDQQIPLSVVVRRTDDRSPSQLDADVFITAWFAPTIPIPDGWHGERVNGGAGNWLILVGVLVLVIGMLVKWGLLGWFGHLPGDIQIRREGFRFYFPLTSMILISVVLSGLFSLLRRFL